MLRSNYAYKDEEYGKLGVEEYMYADELIGSLVWASLM